MDSEEEIDSPPFERNSEGASSCCETRSATNSPSPTPPTPPNLEMVDDAGEEDSGDDEDYLRIMEPICELNCNESEAEEFQEEIKGQLTANPLQLAASPEGGFFQCSVCHKSFHLAGELARHVRSHTLNKPYQCSVSFHPISGCQSEHWISTIHPLLHRFVVSPLPTLAA